MPDITSILKVFANLGDGKFWRSLGWLILGIVFLFLGFTLWAKDTGVGQAAIGVAKRVTV